MALSATFAIGASAISAGMLSPGGNAELLWKQFQHAQHRQVVSTTDAAGQCNAQQVNVQNQLFNRALIGGVSVPFANAQDKFRALASAWESHNSGKSVRDHHHLSHMQIIGMGPTAVPLLLERMKQGQAKWVWALKCITGAEEEAKTSQGNADAVIADWLNWGRANGHIK